MTILDEQPFAILNKLPKLPFGKLLARVHAQAFDLAGYRAALTQAREDILATSTIEGVKQLYAEKLDELKLRAQIIEAVQKGDDQAVTKLSLQLYQTPLAPTPHLGSVLTPPLNSSASVLTPPLNPSLFKEGTVRVSECEREFEEHLTRATEHEVHRHKERVDAKAFVQLAKERLQSYGITDWRVLRSRRPLVQTGHAKLTQSPILRVPNNLHISRARAQRLLAHEVDVHVLRTVNGMHSPLLLLGRGLAGYVNIEEGLALYLQHLADKVSKKLVPGFWQAWTIALLRERGLVEARATLLDARTKLYQATGETAPEQKAELAVQHLLARATRGLSQPGPSGLFFARDLIYRTGYLQIKNFVELHGLVALQDLFVGKINLSHLPLVKTLGLMPHQLPHSLRVTRE